MKQAEVVHILQQCNNRIDRLENDLMQLKREKQEHEQLIDVLGSEMQKVHQRFDRLESKVDRMDEKFSKKFDLLFDALSIKSS